MPNNQTSWDKLGDKFLNDPHAVGFINMVPYGQSEAWQNPNGNEVYNNIFQKEAVEALWAEDAKNLDPVQVWKDAAAKANKAQADFWAAQPSYKPTSPFR